MAEREGFEPPDLSVNGFQDRRHKPLGHLSAYQRIVSNRAGWPGSNDQRPIRKDRPGREDIDMQRHPVEFRCDLCRRRVDDDLRARARRSWEPLIICDTCLREADPGFSRRSPAMAAAAN